MTNTQDQQPRRAVQRWRHAGVWLGAKWKLVLGAMALITAVLVPGLLMAEFATGQDSYLNDDSQIALDNVEFQDQFGGETVILLFSAQGETDISDLFVGSNLEELTRVTDEMRGLEGVYSVITPLVSVTYSEALIAGPGRSALLSAATRDPDPDGQAARSADIPVSLARLGAIPAEEQQLGNPDWVELLLFDNAGFSVTDGELSGPADADRSIRASLASTFPNQQTAVGGVVLTGNASLDEQSAGTEAVLEVWESAEFDGFDVTVTGSPVYLKDINDYLQSGMLKLGLAALAVMAVVLLLLFPVRWRLLPLLAVVVGVLWAFALVGYVGLDLSLVTISGLPILIGLGIDFAIQIHNRVEEEAVLDEEQHPIGVTLSNLGPPLVVATVGAIVAFLALRVSQVPMIRDFGVLLAIGVAVLAVTGIVLPAAVLGIREWTAPSDERKPSVVERIVVALGGLPSKLGGALIVVALVVFGIGAIAEQEVTIESDPVRWIDQGSETVADIDRLEAETGFASTLSILVEANNVLAPEVSQLLWDFTLDAEARPEVVSTSSLVNTMGKIIQNPDASNLVPLPEELEAAAEVMPPDIAAALVSEDRTATQVNLRLAAADLEDRAVLVAALEEDLEQRIDALELDADSILVNADGSGEISSPVRAVPAGLAVVGVGLLENLAANRTILTYLALALVGLWLVLRYRSVTRAALSLVPVVLAVGISAIVVGAFDLTLSPLTTVGGPLVIATCTEFSVLILSRYLEERQHGLPPREATDKASARTGRAFFTSAATTIGGFGVLIGSSLPLLRDFGIIVTLNVAIALLAALVVLPPLLVWADNHNLLSTTDERAVRLAAVERKRVLASAVGAVVMLGVVIAVYAAADTDSGTAEAIEYTPVALPTPTPAPTPEPTPPPEDEDEIDLEAFGTERPEGLVGGTLFDLMTGVGIDAQQAVCTAETLLAATTEADLLAAGLATFSDESLVPVIAAAEACGVEQADIDATIEAARSS